MKKIILNIFLLFCMSLSYAQSTCNELDASIWKDTWASCQKSSNPNSVYGNSHWIQYDLGVARNLSKTWVWNTNDPSQLNQGFKQVKIDYSRDGRNWVHWGAMNFPKANGHAVYGGFAGPDLQQIKARYILITALSNHGHSSCFGLAEVKFNLLPNDDPGVPIRDDEEYEENEEDSEEDEEEEENEENEEDSEEVEQDGEDEEGEEGNEEECALIETVELEIANNEAFIFWEATIEQDFYFIQYGPEGSDDKEIIEIEEQELFVENIDQYIGYELQIGTACGDEILWSDPIVIEEDNLINSGLRSKLSIPQGFQIVPNPTIGQFTLYYNSPRKEMLEYTIAHVTGKILYKKEFPLVKGVNNISIDLSNYANGVYLLNTNTIQSQESISKKVIKNSIN